MAAKRICSIPDCGKPHYALGWCMNHHQRNKKHGDPLAGRTSRGEPLRYFHSTVIPYSGDDCLVWPYGKNESGYGKLWFNGQMRNVSRIICEMIEGPPPTAKHHAAHSCGKGHLACVNPRHISWKTPSGNAQDKFVHGTHNRGERHNMAKITEADVRRIRSLRGQMTQIELASMFGIGSAQVSLIQRGKSWASLKAP